MFTQRITGTPSSKTITAFSSLLHLQVMMHSRLKASKT